MYVPRAGQVRWAAWVVKGVLRWSVVMLQADLIVSRCSRMRRLYKLQVMAGQTTPQMVTPWYQHKGKCKGI